VSIEFFCADIYSYSFCSCLIIPVPFLYIARQRRFAFATSVTPNIKKFIGEIIGKIASELYQLINKEACRLNTYTYEIAYKSKAFKIFLTKGFDFIKEKLMQREIALFLLKRLKFPAKRSRILKNKLQCILFPVHFTIQMD
jgi:hypothetical protein